ncbi:hypothetical protein J2W52_005549 [Rhizobium miluonense]|uniref:NADH-quinone oxidoreductase subunit B n=1 Tax=Rhizobium miluonense TaxID=411945 RepID=A0ABU1SYA4_9HYPH|nr:hypothetical protein [Rhizobium miluonense]
MFPDFWIFRPLGVDRVYLLECREQAVRMKVGVPFYQRPPGSFLPEAPWFLFTRGPLMSSFKDRPVISDFQPPGQAPSGDPLLGTIDSELADKGFLVASTDEFVTWARAGSLMWMTFGLACCAIEMMQMSMPRYDVECIGAAPRGSPRQSDHSDRYLCARVSTHCGSAALRRPASSAQDSAQRDDRAIAGIERFRLLPIVVIR